MPKFKTRIEGTPAQIGQKYPDERRSYAYGAKRGASGAALPPQYRSVDSMKKPASYSKKGLPPSMEKAFRRKPYDIYAIEKYLGTDVSYMGYDVYRVGSRSPKMVRGRELILMVKNKSEKKTGANPQTEYFCPDCGSTFSGADGKVRCPVCKSLNLERKIGKDLYIKADADENYPGNKHLIHKRYPGKTKAAVQSKKKSKKKAVNSIEETPEFQSGYDKGLQEAAVGKYNPHKSKSTNWKKGYDAGWKKAFKDPEYDEIVLINTEEDLTAWEKRRAVMESEEFQTWLAERWHTDPMPKDPYQAYMIDKSLKAKLKHKEEWAQRVNVADYHPIDYPPITKEPPPDIAVPPPKTREAEKTKKLLRARSKYLAKEMDVPEPTLRFTQSRTGRARSYYRSGFGVNRRTGELAKIADPEIVIGISRDGKITPENYAVLAHEMGHHKTVCEIRKEQGDQAVIYHYQRISRSKEATIESERDAWHYADPYLQDHRPAQKWLKKYAFGTYLGTTPGFEYRKQ